MIKSVKIAQGRFIINDSLIVYDLDADEDGIKYKINYDETAITGGEADEIAAEFIETALNHYIKN